MQRLVHGSYNSVKISQTVEGKRTESQIKLLFRQIQKLDICNPVMNLPVICKFARFFNHCVENINGLNKRSIMLPRIPGKPLPGCIPNQQPSILKNQAKELKATAIQASLPALAVNGEIPYIS